MNILNNLINIFSNTALTNTNTNRDIHLINVYNEHLIEYSQNNFNDNTIINNLIEEYLNNINHLTTPTTTSTTSTTHIINEYNLNKYNMLKKSLKLKTKNISNDSIKECNICLENMNNGVCKLDCNHSFHLKCIKKWIKQKKDCPNCPICRKEIK
jgi:hypothetical protein